MGDMLMNYDYDFLLCIARLNPVHNGHMHLFKEALARTKNLIILLGSAESARSPYDPFTLEERREMLEEALVEEIPGVEIVDNNLTNGLYKETELKRIWIVGIPDYSSDNRWVAHVQAEVDDIVYQFADADKKKIGLIGFEKDARTAAYLKKFPQWSRINIKSQYSTINATQIREAYLHSMWHLPASYHAPKAVARFMEKFAHTEQFKWLVDAAEYDRNYNPRDFDNDLVGCADAVVTQSGHVLLGRRRKHPGKGLLALPGGHVHNKGEKKETFKAAVIRELKEESQIADGLGPIPPGKLESFIVAEKFCDNPNRSLRARVISMAYLFRLPDGPLYHVKGSDDMASDEPNKESMKWYSIADIEMLRREMFEDHFMILSSLLSL
jgi:bifunctional NMN adenylyltransferase/nudix hydrolase